MVQWIRASRSVKLAPGVLQIGLLLLLSLLSHGTSPSDIIADITWGQCRVSLKVENCTPRGTEMNSFHHVIITAAGKSWKSWPIGSRWRETVTRWHHRTTVPFRRCHISVSMTSLFWTRKTPATHSASRSSHPSTMYFFRSAVFYCAVHNEHRTMLATVDCWFSALNFFDRVTAQLVHKS